MTPFEYATAGDSIEDIAIQPDADEGACAVCPCQD